MDPLSFLNVENPLINQAKFSQLAGQKAQLMQKTTPGKQSVGAAAVQGGIGGAIAGASMAANMGAFNTPAQGPSATQTAGTENYGDRTAPTIAPEPVQQQPRQQGPQPAPQQQSRNHKYQELSQVEYMSTLLGDWYK